MVMTAALETMAEMIGVLARWLLNGKREARVRGRSGVGLVTTMAALEVEGLKTYPLRLSSALLSSWKVELGVDMEYRVEEERPHPTRAKTGTNASEVI
jgi:hypothetical protein